MPPLIDLEPFVHACLTDPTVLTGKAQVLRRHASAQALDQERCIRELDEIDRLHKRLARRIDDLRPTAHYPLTGA